MSDQKEAVKDSFYPDSIEEALSRWDEGIPLTSISMGGLGPGYEQCIQVGFIELLRELKDATFPEVGQELNDLYDKALDRVLERTKLGGITGAQAGAMKNLSSNFLRDESWEEVLDSCKDRDRRIQISKAWPH